MGLRRRIWSLPLISIVVFGLGLAVSTYFSRAALSSIGATEVSHYPVLRISDRLIAGVQNVADEFEGAVVEGETARLAAAELRAKAVTEAIKSLAAIGAEQDLATRLEQLFADYYLNAARAARLMLKLESGDLQGTVQRMQAAQNTLQGALTEFNLLAQQRFATSIAASETSVRRTLQASIVAALLVIACLTVVSYLVARGVWNQLGGEPEYARQIARAVAAGDLATDIVTAKDDNQSVLAALKHMKIRLADMMASVKTASATIQHASSDIAAGNTDLAGRTQAQTESLAQTAESMQRMTHTVRQNASNAQQAEELAATASNIAVKGRQVVGHVVTTMSAIDGSSKKIVDIVAVIDSIAFQTNILALNAAVEAARAGEHGSGFAVVAAEVRNLAQRSAVAAKEIKALIMDSVARVGEGTKLVDQAGHTMSDIVASVKRVTDITREITVASREQSSGIEAIGRAVQQMDRMTLQNASLVEEASASAGSLREQVEQLGKILAIFKLANTSDQSGGSSQRQSPTEISHGIEQVSNAA
jgi:methyl-accepting chemotaxis protein